MRIDGRPAQLGDVIDPVRTIVTVNGHRLQPDTGNKRETLVFNKPAGVITTMRDERGRKSITAFLPSGHRLFPVGRLDADTTGLLLCTNDGDLANFLTRAHNRVPRTYQVTVRGQISTEAAAVLQARGIRASQDGSTTFSLTLYEGRNRQVRRMCVRHGLRVVSLMRTRFGPVRLGKLGLGCTRALTAREEADLARLRKQAISEGSPSLPSWEPSTPV